MLRRRAAGSTGAAEAEEGAETEEWRKRANETETERLGSLKAPETTDVPPFFDGLRMPREKILPLTALSKSNEEVLFIGGWGWDADGRGGEGEPGRAARPADRFALFSTRSFHPANGISILSSRLRVIKFSFNELVPRTYF